MLFSRKEDWSSDTRSGMEDLENITLRETSQTQRCKQHMVLFIRNISTRQIHTERTQVRGYQGLGGGEDGESLLTVYRMGVTMGWK